MKKILAIALAALMAASLLAVCVTAEEGIPSNMVFTKVNTTLNTCRYEIPDAKAGGYGMDWYDDDEGQQKLFDGVIPTEADLNAAKLEKNAEDETINEYWAWEGWIALAKTKEAFVLNSKVKIDFAFDLEITLSEIGVYACAMTTGSVGIPKLYSVYVSEDGEIYTKAPVATAEASGKSYEYLQEATAITLEKPVKAKYIRLVMDASEGAAWTFLSEVEFYEDLTAKDVLTVAEFELEAAEEESSEASKEESKTSSTAVSSKGESSESASRATSFAPTVSSGSDDGGFPTWAYFAIGAGVLVIAAAAFIFIRKKKQA